MVQILDVLVLQIGDQLVDVLRRFDNSVAEQIIASAQDPLPTPSSSRSSQ